VLVWIAVDTTAIATVPIATRFVIFVVANTVSFVVWQFACTFDLRNAGIRVVFDCTVQALALFAVIVVAGAAAISSVPIATGIVIFVITSVVAFPRWLAANALDFRDALVTRCFVFTIQAIALFAVFVLIGLAIDTAAITLVPVTPGIVVFVVADAITHESFFFTETLDVISACIAFVLERAVQALAVAAMRVIVVLPTTISPIPAATGVVVLVITDPVALPSGLSALRFDMRNA